MREIIPRRLWLGNAADGRDARVLHSVGIRAVVDLALEEMPPELPRELTLCRFPLIDGSGNSQQVLSAAIEATAILLAKQVPMLVCCSGGMSRSPAIAAAALALADDRSLEECLQQLTTDQPHDVSPALWTDIQTVYNHLNH